MGWTTVIWFVVGYSLCFSGDVGGVIGNLDMAFLRGVTLATPSPNPGDPTVRAHRLPDDVRDHHPGADHRRFHQPGLLQGLHGFPDRVAALRLLSVRAHALGRRNPAEVGRSGLCRRHRGAQHRRNGGAGVGPLCRPAASDGRRAAQHSAGGAGHRSPLVWLVWLQRRQRVPGRLGHRGRFPEYRCGRVVRGHHLADGRLVVREAADIRRPADRRGRRPGHHHAGGGLCLASHRGDHRDRVRQWSATSPWR